MSTRKFKNNVKVIGDLDVTTEYSSIAYVIGNEAGGGGTRQSMTTTPVKVNNAFWSSPPISGNTTKASLLTYQSGSADFLISRAGLYRIDAAISYRQITNNTNECRDMSTQLYKNGSPITNATSNSASMHDLNSSVGGAGNASIGAVLLWLETFAVNDTLSFYVSSLNVSGIVEIASLRFMIQSV